MNLLDYIQIAVFIGVFVLIAMVLGRYIGKIFSEAPSGMLKPLCWLERGVYRLARVDPTKEMDWKEFAIALTAFNLVGLIIVLLLQLCQGYLPLNPAKLPNVPFWLALNTAISFMTNTNWQAYAGEVTMSYLTQMLGLTVHNFVSAATGMAVMTAVARGLARKSTRDLGNFWVDMTKTVIYLLLPLSIILAIILVSQGVIQNFSSYLAYQTVEGAHQMLPMGPVASQIAIKQLGTNGGGFFGVNSAHPFENATPFSNFLQMLAIIIIPAAIPIAFGRLVKNPKHGYAVFTAMLILFLLGLAAIVWSEGLTNPATFSLSFWEGKELRFGLGNSALWTATTTVTSNGSVNAMIDSFSPLAGGVAMLNLMLGEVIFGGIGSGMYGMVLFIILTVFIAGLMVGRTPEYLGKKIEAKEIKLAVIGVLLPSAGILAGAALACRTHLGLSSLANQGPHGLSEILYAFSSAVGNNGSAFGGLNANTNFYTIGLGLAMLLGRFAVIYPVLAIAGSLAMKKQTPPSPGTFPTEGSLFAVLLCSVILIIGGLTFFPALSLAPVIEHVLMLSGRVF